MVRRSKWQFSVRSIVLIVLLSGPIAGGLAGTFGKSLQEVFLLMIVVGLTSLALAFVAAAVAFFLMSPLLIVETYVRRDTLSGPKAQDDEPVSANQGPEVE